MLDYILIGIGLAMLAGILWGYMGIVVSAVFGDGQARQVVGAFGFLFTLMGLAWAFGSFL